MSAAMKYIVLTKTASGQRSWAIYETFKSAYDAVLNEYLPNDVECWVYATDGSMEHHYLPFGR